MSERVLEVNNLHVSFDITAGEVQAVRGVDFFLNKGETLAIVGESGSQICNNKSNYKIVPG